MHPLKGHSKSEAAAKGQGLAPMADFIDTKKN
jgi:hypothetical protein